MFSNKLTALFGAKQIHLPHNNSIMKKDLLRMLAVSAVLVLVSACNRDKVAPVTEVTKVKEDTVEVAEPVNATLSVTGIVQAISRGKDGYTAQLSNLQDTVQYYATISHANLQDPSQYRDANVGDTLSVAGDSWQMDGKQQITVRSLK